MPDSETPEPRDFNPTEHMMKLQGKDYLPVAPRTLWFRSDFPIAAGWGIRTQLIDGGWTRGYAVFKATITDPEGREVGSGTAVEIEPVLGKEGRRTDGFPDYVEKAETSAIGRALATCGYGTLGALDEGDVCDAPAGRAQPPRERPGGAPRPQGQGYSGDRSTGHGGSSNETLACECGKPLTKAQHTLSVNKFAGRSLCPDCQRSGAGGARPAPAPAPAAEAPAPAEEEDIEFGDAVCQFSGCGQYLDSDEIRLCRIQFGDARYCANHRRLMNTNPN